MTATPFTRTTLVRMAVAVAAGFGSGVLVAKLANAVGLRKAQMRLSDDLALVTGAVLVAAATYFLVLSFDRRRLARAIECDPALPASDDEAAQARLQAGVLLLAGLLMPLPVLAGPAARGDPTVGALALGACLVGLGLQSVLNWRLWNRSDEVLRGLVVKAAAASFWIGQIGLYAIAAAVRLAGLAEPGAFDLLVATLILYLAASAVIAIRLRGRG